MNYKEYKPITDEIVNQGVERELRPIRKAAIQSIETQVRIFGALRHAITGEK